MVRYFNTAFSLSMLAALPAEVKAVGKTEVEAREWLETGHENVANPSHANTLSAVSQKLGVDVRSAKGGRVALSVGDEMLVAQVVFPPSVPRETTEYSDEQLALGRFSFVLVTRSA